jgi:hypothetical protein
MIVARSKECPLSFGIADLPLNGLNLFVDNDPFS